MQLTPQRERPSSPLYPRRARRFEGRGERIRRIAVALGLSSTLLLGAMGRATAEPSEAAASTESSHEPDWMIWLEDVGFCPMMDCEPEPEQGVRVIMGRLAGVTVSPTLSRGTIQRYIRAQSNRVRGCYEHRLQGSPSLEGRVTVRFLIEQDGLVQGAHVARSTIQDADVEQCVVETIRSIRFPALSERALSLVSYPFFFRPRRE